MGVHHTSILVIDTDDLNRELIAQILTEAGHCVRTAGDDTAALTQIAQAAPDVVVLDYALSPVVGRAVLAQLRRPGAPQIPALVLSATHPEDECLRAGATAYLRKPFDLDDLVLAVARCYGHGAAQDKGPASALR